MLLRLSKKDKQKWAVFKPVHKHLKTLTKSPKSLEFRLQSISGLYEYEM